MKKTLLFTTLSFVTLYGGFWSNLSFAYGHGKGHVDKNFVRDENRSVVWDIKHHKFYYDATPSEKMHFTDALNYCNKMEYLGYREWRVPTKEEMRSLLELSRREIRVKHAFKYVQKGIYWSSTEDRLHKVWYFDFDLGRYFVAKKDKKFYVLCVGSEKR